MKIIIIKKDFHKNADLERTDGKVASDRGKLNTG